MKRNRQEIVLNTHNLFTCGLIRELNKFYNIEIELEQCVEDCHKYFSDNIFWAVVTISYAFRKEFIELFKGLKVQDIEQFKIYCPLVSVVRNDRYFFNFLWRISLMYEMALYCYKRADKEKKSEVNYFEMARKYIVEYTDEDYFLSAGSWSRLDKIAHFVARLGAPLMPVILEERLVQRPLSFTDAVERVQRRLKEVQGDYYIASERINFLVELKEKINAREREVRSEDKTQNDSEGERNEFTTKSKSTCLEEWKETLEGNDSIRCEKQMSDYSESSLHTENLNEWSGKRFSEGREYDSDDTPDVYESSSLSTDSETRDIWLESKLDILLKETEKDTYSALNPTFAETDTKSQDAIQDEQDSIKFEKQAIMDYLKHYLPTLYLNEYNAKELPLEGMESERVSPVISEFRTSSMDTKSFNEEDAISTSFELVTSFKNTDLELNQTFADHEEKLDADDKSQGATLTEFDRIAHETKLIFDYLGITTESLNQRNNKGLPLEGMQLERVDIPVKFKPCGSGTESLNEGNSMLFESMTKTAEDTCSELKRSSGMEPKPLNEDSISRSLESTTSPKQTAEITHSELNLSSGMDTESHNEDGISRSLESTTGPKQTAEITHSDLNQTFAHYEKKLESDMDDKYLHETFASWANFESAQFVSAKGDKSCADDSIINFLNLEEYLLISESSNDENLEKSSVKNKSSKDNHSLLPESITSEASLSSDYSPEKVETSLKGQSNEHATSSNELRILSEQVENDTRKQSVTTEDADKNGSSQVEREVSTGMLQSYFSEESEKPEEGDASNLFGFDAPSLDSVSYSEQGLLPLIESAASVKKPTLNTHSELNIDISDNLYEVPLASHRSIPSDHSSVSSESDEEIETSNLDLLKEDLRISECSSDENLEQSSMKNKSSKDNHSQLVKCGLYSSTESIIREIFLSSKDSSPERVETSFKEQNENAASNEQLGILSEEVENVAREQADAIEDTAKNDSSQVGRKAKKRARKSQRKKKSPRAPESSLSEETGKNSSLKSQNSEHNANCEDFSNLSAQVQEIIEREKTYIAQEMAKSNSADKIFLENPHLNFAPLDEDSIRQENRVMMAYFKKLCPEKLCERLISNLTSAEHKEKLESKTNTNDPRASLASCSNYESVKEGKAKLLEDFRRTLFPKRELDLIDKSSRKICPENNPTNSKLEKTGLQESLNDENLQQISLENEAGSKPVLSDAGQSASIIQGSTDPQSSTEGKKGKKKPWNKLKSSQQHKLLSAAVKRK